MLPAVPLVLVLTQTISGQYKDGASAGIVRKFNVAIPVSDDEGLLQVNSKFCDGAFQHPRLWLAAIARLTVGRLTHRRMVRAVIDRIKAGSGHRHLLHQFLMHSLHEVFGEVASS